MTPQVTPPGATFVCSLRAPTAPVGVGLGEVPGTQAWSPLPPRHLREDPGHRLEGRSSPRPAAGSETSEGSGKHREESAFPRCWPGRPRVTRMPGDLDAG